MRRKGTQRPLSAAIEGLERRLDKASAGRFLQVRVADAWQHVVGRTVAEHTTDVFLRAGELVVHVDSNVWASELSSLTGPYITALNAELGRDLVTSIRFTVSRKVRQRQLEEQAREERDALYAPNPSAAIPLTPAERAQVEASAASIDDEELREAVVKATIASMEWRKGQRAAKSGEAPREGL